MTVAALGPAGTYSHEAAVKRFHQEELTFCSSLSEVVESVGSGRCAFGVLPVENSSNGVVHLAVEALVKSQHQSTLGILDDVKVRIRHQLYTNAKSLSSVETVYSHPQVWGQTSHWLRTNLPHAKLVDVDSTSTAVSKVLGNETSVSEAAIGGPNSSQSTPFVENCCDNPENTTRFLVLSHVPPKTTDINCIYGPARVHFVEPRSTIGEVAQKYAGTGELLFVSEVPADASWKYDLYVDLAVKTLATVDLPSNCVLGVESL